MRQTRAVIAGLAALALGGCYSTVEEVPPENPPVVEEQPAAPVAPGEIPVGDPGEYEAATEPPPLVYEEPPPSPGPGYVWIAGYWHWNGTGWEWIYGAWRPAMAGYTYVDPYYEVVGGAVVYVPGYWHRGPRIVRSYGGRVILFARPARPVGYRPGVRVVVRPHAGVRVGVRVGARYRPAGRATRVRRVRRRGPRVRVRIR